jgi:osmotically-inducible protein OsmY
MQTLIGATMVRSQLVLNNADRELERRVSNFLSQQHFPRLRGIEVEARQGVVSLRGRVRSFHERQLCIHCCQRVAGVVGVNDKIQVSMIHEPEAAGAILGFIPSVRAFAPAG